MTELIGKLEDFSQAFNKKNREDFLWFYFLLACQARTARKWNATQLVSHIDMAKDLIRLIQSLIDMLPLLRALYAEEDASQIGNIPYLAFHVQTLEDFFDAYDKEIFEEELQTSFQAMKEQCNAEWGWGTYNKGFFEYSSRQFTRMAGHIFDLEDFLPELIIMKKEAAARSKEANTNHSTCCHDSG